MREMKDSGVEWIGEIPETWIVERLQWHLDEIKESNSPIKTTQVLSLTNKAGVIPYEDKGEQGNKAKENYDEYKLAYPDTIVANSMNILIGSVGICRYFGCVSPVYYVFKPKENELLSYLNYVFQMEQFQKELRRYANGILEIRLRISSANIIKRYVALPSHEEQIAISHFLDRKCTQIDALISNAQQQIEKLKAYKQSVITETVTKGLDPDVEMKDSGVEWIGEIPEHWKVIRLKFLLQYIIDCPHETPNYSFDGEYYVIRTADEDYGFLRADEQMYRLDEKEYKHRIRRLSLDKDDIVYGREGERWGLACIVPESNKYCLGQRMMQFRCNEHIVPMFIMWALNSKNIYVQGCFDTLGSTSPHVNISTIINYEIPIPSYEEQNKLASFLEEKCSQIDKLITLKQQKIEKLQQYKKSLIYEYVTGKKEV